MRKKGRKKIKELSSTNKRVKGKLKKSRKTRVKKTIEVRSFIGKTRENK